MAPPTPPTTPPMIFLVLELIPELLELSLSLFRTAALVTVEKPVVDTRVVLPVLVRVADWPLVTVTMVVVNASVELASSAEVMVVLEVVFAEVAELVAEDPPAVAVVPAAAEVAAPPDVASVVVAVVSTTAEEVGAEVVAASVLVAAADVSAVVVGAWVVSSEVADGVLEDDVGSWVEVAWVAEVAAVAASGVLGADAVPEAACLRWKNPRA